MGKTPSLMPVPKVTIGALAGAITTIAVGLLDTCAKIDVPADVAGAITILLTFVASYFTPSEVQEGSAAAGTASAAPANGCAPGAEQGYGRQALLISGEPIYVAWAEKARNGL
jgi:hypothetical protein